MQNAGANTKSDAGENPVMASITIQMRKNGDVTVQGPLANRVLMYGLMHAAMDIIQEQAGAANDAKAPGA